VTDALGGHAALRDVVELLMDERNQLLEGRLVALPPSEEKPGDLCGRFSNGAILAPFHRFKF